MLTLTMHCEVPPDRVFMLKLPEGIEPGRHEFTILISETAEFANIAPSDADTFVRFSDTMSLIAMANDPSIQRELALIEQEFAVTGDDGLDGL